MKRTKQIEQLIETTNNYLRLNHIKDMGDPAFLVVTNSLLKMDIYRGFNYYKMSSFTHNGKDYPIATTCPEEECEYIQIY